MTEMEISAAIKSACTGLLEHLPVPKVTTKVAQEPAVLLNRRLAGEDMYESVVRERHYQEASSEQQAAMDQAKDSAKKHKVKKEKEKERATTAPTSFKSGKLALALADEAHVQQMEEDSSGLPAADVTVEEPDADLYGDMGGDMDGGDNDLYGDLDDDAAAVENDAGAAGGDDNNASGAGTDGVAIGVSGESADMQNDGTAAAGGLEVQRTEEGLLGDEATGAYPLAQSVSEHFGQNTTTGRLKLINAGLRGSSFATLFLEKLPEAKAIIGGA